jgi:hypothetical protein
VTAGPPDPAGAVKYVTSPDGIDAAQMLRRFDTAPRLGRRPRRSGQIRSRRQRLGMTGKRR